MNRSLNNQAGTGPCKVRSLTLLGGEQAHSKSNTPNKGGPRILTLQL